MNDCPICIAAGKLCPRCAKKFYPGRVLQARQARGISRKELARRSGFSQYKLRHWENGTQKPELAQVVRLGNALDLKPIFFTRPPYTLDGPTFYCSRQGGCQVIYHGGKDDDGDPERDTERVG